MQIHELTKKQLDEASIVDRIKTGVQNIQDRSAAANVAAGKAQQDKIQAQAAAAAQKLQAQGYKPSTVAPVAGQPIKVTANISGVSGDYVKTATGWQNELGQPITNPQSIAYLDSLLPKTAPVAPGVAATNQAGAVMTTVDVDRAIRQLGLSQQQLTAFQTQAQQNPGFVRAFLKRLGLVR